MILVGLGLGRVGFGWIMWWRGLRLGWRGKWREGFLDHLISGYPNPIRKNIINVMNILNLAYLVLFYV